VLGWEALALRRWEASPSACRAQPGGPLVWRCRSGGPPCSHPYSHPPTLYAWAWDFVLLPTCLDPPACLLDPLPGPLTDPCPSRCLTPCLTPCSTACLQSEEHMFTPAEPQWGFTSFVSRASLLDPAQGFLRPDGSVLIRAAVTPLRP